MLKEGMRTEEFGKVERRKSRGREDGGKRDELKKRERWVMREEM